MTRKMIFEDIQVGDTVLVPTRIHFGFHGKRFYLPRKVLRVTKTQFDVEAPDHPKPRRYMKLTGNPVGFGSPYSDTVRLRCRQYQDETEEYRRFKKKCALVQKIQNGTSAAQSAQLFDYTNEELTEASEAVDALLAALSND